MPLTHQLFCHQQRDQNPLVTMASLILFLALLFTLAASVTATLLVASGATAATAVTVGTTLSATTAAAVAGAALTAAGIGTAAAIGALAATAVARGVGPRRQKREAGPACFGLDNTELMYILAANSDQLGCGQRLVCELEATPDSELSDIEQDILGLFGRDVRPLKASQMLNPKAAYHYAAQVGSKASSAAECAEVFDLCPLDRPAIMATYARFAQAGSGAVEEKHQAV